MDVKNKMVSFLNLFLGLLSFLFISTKVLGQQTTEINSHLQDVENTYVKAIKTNTISKNGKWIVIENLTNDKLTNVLINTELNYKKEIDQSKSFVFSVDNSMLYYIENSNRLMFFDLNKKEIIQQYKLDVPQFKFSYTGDKLGIISNESLYIVDKVGRMLKRIPRVKEFEWNPTSDQLMLTFEQKKNNSYQLILYDLVNDVENVIADQQIPLHLKYWDKKGKRLLFFDENKSTLYSYDDDQEKVSSLEVGKKFPDYTILIHRVAYLNDAETVILSIKKNIKLAEEGFERWNSTSKWVEPRMKTEYDNEKRIETLVWEYKKGEIKQIDKQHFSNVEIQSTSSLVLMYDKLQYEPQYLREVEADLYTIDLKTLERKKIIDKQYISSNFISISPSGRYVVYFKNQHWNIVDRQKGTNVAMTSTASDIFFNNQSLSKIHDPYSQPIWTENENEVFVHAEYDIWVYTLSDHSFKKLTQGRKSKTTYRIDPINYLQNKEIGLYSKFKANVLKEQSSIFVRISYLDYSSNYASLENKVLKELDLKSPQFYTTNFVNDTILLFVKEKYNYSPELWSYSVQNKTSKLLYETNLNFKDLKSLHYNVLHYKDKKNKLVRSSLLYPKNYDATKKYPMVVWVYEKKSKEINKFIPLYDYNEDGFNILNYVENGYFVLLPDIVYELGNPGISALEYTEFAVNKVVNLGLVDSSKIGLMGFSFGGYESAFISMQSKLFKTAVVGSGITDLASWYHTYNTQLKNEQMWRLEGFQLRMGESYYKSKDNYIKNSPTTYVEKLKIPLLIWSGKEDWNVNVNQSIYLFMAMKRLGKEGELLLYDKEKHGLLEPKNQKHLTQKIFNWFEYYLK